MSFAALFAADVEAQAEEDIIEETIESNEATERERNSRTSGGGKAGTISLYQDNYLDENVRVRYIRDIKEGKLIIKSDKLNDFLSLIPDDMKNIRDQIMKDRTMKFDNKCDIGPTLSRISPEENKVIGVGMSNTVSKICSSCEIPYILKTYSNTDQYTPKTQNNFYYNINSDTNVDSRVNYLLNNFVKYKISSHINMLATDFICDDKQNNKIKYQITEYLDGDLNKYMQLNPNFNALVVIFQISYILAAIQKIFPRFRHNDLAPRNVLIKFKDDIGKFYLYEYDDQYFKIPGIGFECRLNDFDFSSISGLIDNDKVIRFSTYRAISYTYDSPNLSYDIYSFMKDLWEYEYMGNENLKIISNYYKVHKYAIFDGYLIPNYQMLTPDDIIKGNVQKIKDMKDLMFTYRISKDEYEYLKLHQQNILDIYNGNISFPQINFNDTLQKYISYDISYDVPFMGYKNKIARQRDLLINPVIPYYESKYRLIIKDNFTYKNNITFLEAIYSNITNYTNINWLLHDINIFKQFIYYCLYVIIQIYTDRYIDNINTLTITVLEKCFIWYGYYHYRIKNDKNRASYDIIALYKQVYIQDPKYQMNGFAIVPDKTQEIGKLHDYNMISELFNRKFTVLFNLLKS